MALLYAASGITIVRPEEVAMVLRWGRLVGDTPALQQHGAGLLFAFPRPIDEVVRVQTKRVAQIQLSTLDAGAGNPPADEEDQVALGGNSLDPVREGYALTGDENIVQVAMVARYRVRDPGVWRFYAAGAEDVLRTEVTAAMVRSIGEMGVDRVLSDGRKDLIATATRRAQAGLDAAGSGLELSSLELTRLGPPAALVYDFSLVQSAFIGAETKKKDAQAFAETAVPQATAQSDAALQAARASAASDLALAKGEVGRLPRARSRVSRERRCGARATLSRRRRAGDRREQHSVGSAASGRQLSRLANHGGVAWRGREGGASWCGGAPVTTVALNGDVIVADQELGALAPEERRRISQRLGAGLVGLGLLGLGTIIVRLAPEQWQIGELIRGIAAAVVGVPTLVSGVRGVVSGDTRRATDQLVAIAVLAAAATGSFVTATLIPLFLELGRLFEERSALGARAAIDGIRALSARQAVRLRGGDVEERVDPRALAVGDEILVRPGERIAVDGTVIEGRAAVDQSAITGESLHEDVGPGSAVFAGTIAIDGLLRIQVRGTGQNTVLGRVVHLLAELERTSVPALRLFERRAGVWLPLVLTIAATTLFFTQQLSRAIAVLVVATPTALVVAGPAAVVAAMSVATRLRILIKSADFFERASEVDTLILDKTGTVTVGAPTVTHVRPEPGETEETLLATAASCGFGSLHPVSKAVVAEAQARNVADRAAQRGSGTRGPRRRGDGRGTAGDAGPPSIARAARHCHRGGQRRRRVRSVGGARWTARRPICAARSAAPGGR